MKGGLLGALSLAAGLVVITIVVRRAGGELSAADLLLSPTAHALALSAFAVDMTARGLRVSILARALGEPLTLRTSVFAQLAADAAGSVTPSRVGSDPAKLAVLARDGVRLGPGAAIMAGEILVEAIVLAGLVISFALAVPVDGAIALGALTYCVTVAVTTLVAIRVARTPRETPPAWLAGAPGVALRWPGLRASALQFADRARALLRLSPATLTALVVATAVHLAARLAILPVLVVTDHVVERLLPLVTWPLVLLYAGALVPAPASGGVVELGFAAALDAQLPAAVLATALVWWRFYTFYLAALAGGIVLLAAPRTRRLATTRG